MKLSAEVRRNLNEAAASVFTAGAELVNAIGSTCAAAATWFEERSEIYAGRAELEDADALEDLTEDE